MQRPDEQTEHIERNEFQASWHTPIKRNNQEVRENDSLVTQQ